MTEGILFYIFVKYSPLHLLVQLHKHLYPYMLCFQDWKHKKLDLRNIRLGTPGEKSVCVEFEIDDLQVLLSDFFAWHSVLNGGFYNYSHTEAEWN